VTDLTTLQTLAAEVIAEFAQRSLQLATAESCTGGLVAAALTEIAGSSRVIDRGFVTYSNRSKVDLLGVPASLIETEGAVSESVARAMAEGAIDRSEADFAVAVTGIAGPGGGTPEKPVGLVHFALARREGETQHVRRQFKESDGRSVIRFAAVREALVLLREAAGPQTP
jgi:nicotinamide-nucleotide amidase